jgi:predicted nucleic acid-binding protein
METLAKMDIQKMIASGDILLAASDYLINENSMKKDEDIRNHIYDFVIKNVVIFVSDKDPRLDPFIKEAISSGVKDVDSAHVAAAIVAGCDYFITTDDRILKYRTDRIKIVTPIQFLTENEVR